MLNTAIADAHAAALDSRRPGRLKRVVAYAAIAGRTGEAFSSVETALDGDAAWWNRAPKAARRASVMADQVCRDAFRGGQRERAKAAMIAHMEDRERARAAISAHMEDREAPRAEHLINVAARATHCADGDNSTLIDAEDLVELVVEILGEDAADNAHADIYDLASEALGTFHFQIVVDQDHADALRASERYAARIVDTGHAMPAIDRLADLIIAEDDLVDMEDARDIAQRAIARGRLERDAEATKVTDMERSALLWECRESLEAMYEAHKSCREVSQVLIATPAEILHPTIPDQLISATVQVGGDIISPSASWSPQPTIDLKDPTVWRDPPRDLFPVALIDDEDEKPAASSKMVDHLNDLTNPIGLVGEIMDWMEASSDRPNRSLLLGAALTLVGTLAGRNYASDTNLRTNNYIVTLAPSGHGKDHALAQIKTLVLAADLDRYVGPGRIMSASALRNLLKREPTVGCYIDEFGGLMNQIHDRKAGIHNAMIRNDLLSLFTEAGTFFAGAEYAAAPAEKIMAPNLSINGTSTPSQFWGSLASMSGEDGLLARMILLDVKGAKPARRAALTDRCDVPGKLVDALRRLAGGPQSNDGRSNMRALTGKSPKPFTVQFDAVAAGHRDAFKLEEDEGALAAGEADELARTVINRSCEHAIKLALVVAIGENPDAPVISGPTMEWAIRLARLSTHTIIKESADRIADSEYSRVYNKVLALIKNAGSAGITEGKIIDRLKIEARPRDQALKDLQTAGRIEFVRESKTGRGRCKERYVFLR